MKMNTRFATLLTILATAGPLLSATEVERLRALCVEQEMQIKQLELKISRLTDTPPPSLSTTTSAVTTPSDFQPISEDAGYTVKAGDSIDRIAGKHGISTAALAKLNGLKTSSIIHPGQKLKVPGKNATAKNSPTQSHLGESTKHKIQSGETYYKISRRYGITVDQLIAANPGIAPNSLRVGQSLNIFSAVPQIAKSSKKNPSTKPAPSLDTAPSIPVSNKPVEKLRATDKPIQIEKEITYGQFAKNHNTTPQRLDELNGLELDPTTVLAQGSELYIPAQP